MPLGSSKNCNGPFESSAGAAFTAKAPAQRATRRGERCMVIAVRVSEVASREIVAFVLVLVR